jgi:hypothetical protein
MSIRLPVFIFICLIGGVSYTQNNGYYFKQNGNEISLYICLANENDTFPDFNFRRSSKNHFLDTSYYQFYADTLIIKMSKTPNTEKLVRVSHKSESDKLMYVEGTFRELLPKDIPNGLLAKFKLRKKKIKFEFLKN